MPNRLRWTDEGLFVMGQHTDNVYLLDEDGRVVRTLDDWGLEADIVTIGTAAYSPARHPLLTKLQHSARPMTAESQRSAQ